jgi:PadR family transcriptional regulator PadR
VYSEEEETATSWLKETKKGYIRIVVLVLLSKKPYHGYEIMREIKERTGGFLKPTAGGIYPILQDLEQSGYIEGEWDLQKKRKRKTYRITESGRPILERALAKESQITDSMSGLFKEFIKDVLNLKLRPSAIPTMPNLFSMFLEERKEKPEDTTSDLESKRAQIEEMIENLQTELKAINKRLTSLGLPRSKARRGKPRKKGR